MLCETKRPILCIYVFTIEENQDKLLVNGTVLLCFRLLVYDIFQVVMTQFTVFIMQYVASFSFFTGRLIQNSYIS